VTSHRPAARGGGGSVHHAAAASQRSAFAILSRLSLLHSTAVRSFLLCRAKRWALLMVPVAAYWAIGGPHVFALYCAAMLAGLTAEFTDR